jgi:lysophospholipase L1-like esterase
MREPNGRFSSLGGMTALRVLLALALGVAWLPGAAALPVEEASAVPIRVACIGDSITAGGFPNDLGAMLGPGYVVGNFGVAGATLLKQGDFSYWNLGEFQAAGKCDPNLVVVMLGTNDAKERNWAHRADFAKDYRAMLDHFTDLPGRPTVFACLPPRVFNNSGYDIVPALLDEGVVPAIRQVAAEAKVPCIDVWSAFAGHPEYVWDNVHPNAAGNQAIAHTMAEAIRRLPRIIPAGGPFLGQVAVRVECELKDAVLRYTLDGSVPTEKSPVYKTPLTVTGNIVLRVVAFMPDPILSVAAAFTKATLRPAQDLGLTEPGLAYAYFEAEPPDRLVDLSALTPVLTGVVETCSLDPKRRETNFGFRYTGFISVPRDGIYTFSTTSDDGSALLIGERRVVENGGFHAMVESMGTIALQAGRHPFSVTFVQGGGGYGLEVRWTGPGLAKQLIPAEAFSHPAKPAK